MTLRFFLACTTPIVLATLFAASCVDNSDCTRTATCPSSSGGGGAGAGSVGGGGTTGGGTSPAGGAGGMGSLGLGEACGVPNECTSGFCVDGVCCAEACEGECAACDSAGSCTPHSTGTDPDAECDGGVCDGAGLCAQGEFVWGQRFGDGGNQWAKAVGAMSTGDVVLAGRAPGSVNFGTGALTNGDLFVARFDRGGQGVWAAKWGDSGIATVTDVALDGGDNIYVTARTSGMITIGGSTITDGLPESFDPGVGFIFKLNASGSELWAREFNDGEELSDAKVAVSDAGDAYLVGYYQGAAQVSDGPALPDSTSTGIFFGRLTPSGSHVWSIGYANVSPLANAQDLSATVMSSGDVAFLADFGSGVSIGGQTATNDSVVIFDANGNPKNVAVIPEACGARGLHESPNGNLLVACANGKLFTTDGMTTSIVYQPTLLGSQTSVQASAIAPTGNLLLLGNLSGDSDFGGGSLVSAGADDIFLVKIAFDGTHLWSYSWGDAGNQCSSAFPNECGRDVTADADGNILLGGALRGEVSFGGAPLIVDGTYDAFLVKLTP